MGDISESVNVDIIITSVLRVLYIVIVVCTVNVHKSRMVYDRKFTLYAFHDQ